MIAVEAALQRHGAPIYARRHIIHNRIVVDRLRERGVRFVEEVDEVPPGAVVVYSAHGVAPSVRIESESRELTVVDATCPLVNKVHREVQSLVGRGYEVLLLGHQGHEEVDGVAGEAPDRVHVVWSPEEIRDVAVSDAAKVGWVSQTTLSVDEVFLRVNWIRQRFPALQDPPSDDICFATQNRQAAVRAIAPRCDVVLVVGSETSSNAQRLVEVALESGAAQAHLLESARNLRSAWLDDAGTVGVTSGASTPDYLVQELLAALAAQGWDDVEQVTVASENLTFSLPRELTANASPDAEALRRHSEPQTSP